MSASWCLRRGSEGMIRLGLAMADESALLGEWA